MYFEYLLMNSSFLYSMIYIKEMPQLKIVGKSVLIPHP